MVDKRGTNPRSLANLRPKRRDKKKLYLTLLPNTISWLKSRGNASSLIDYMVENAAKGLFTPDLLERIEILRAENAMLKKQIKELYKLRELEAKIKAKEKGYMTNSFSKGLAQLQEILQCLTP
jgi:hypothetical protein